MIKLPEPVSLLRCHTAQEAYHYTEAQLKQAVRDALTLAATECKALDDDENSEDYRNGANWCAERIGALIKEI